MLRVDRPRFLATIEELAKFGSTGAGGVTRVCLSREEVEARRYIRDLMLDADLEVHLDPVANVIGFLPAGSRENPVMCGSHIDSVVKGGKLDGSYGTLGAIEAARVIMESGLHLKHPLAAVCFTNEEGVRFPAMTGSKYMAALIERKAAHGQLDYNGSTFKDVLGASGLRLSHERIIGPGKKTPHAFVELHIEQGPILESEGADIGAVTSIVGVTQYDITIEGLADHAGTTPMRMRRDALLAASKVVLEVNRLAERINESVGTVGRVTVAPNVPNVVPGETSLTVDFRHSSNKVLLSARRELLLIVRSISKVTSTKISMRPRIFLRPARMADGIVGAVANSARGLGLTSRRIQSGAGHDTMIMNRMCNTGMIFVPSKGGKSHSPLEATAARDLVNGANVLLNTLAYLCT